MPDAAQAVGVVVRRAVETPTNVLIVSGIWVLNLPGLVLNTLLILLILGGGVGGLRELALSFRPVFVA